MIIKDFPLIGFTLFSQLSVGALILYNLIIFLPTYRNRAHLPAQFKTIPVLAFLFALIAVFISVFHLGKPFRALNTLENLSTSWLSREIFILIIYVFFSGLFTFFILKMNDWKRLILLTINLATISGVVLIFTMSKIYSSMPIPAWHPVFTLLNFTAVTLTLGGVFLLLFQIRRGSWSGQKSLAWIIGIVMLLEVVSIPIFLSYLDHNSNASQLSLKILLDDFNLVFYFRLGFQILSLGFIFMTIFNIRSDTDKCKKLMWPAMAAASFIFISEFLGRVLFYAIEVPIGSL